MPISRPVKLRLSKSEKHLLDTMLFQLEGVWNWTLQVIETELPWYRIEAPILAKKAWLKKGAPIDKPISSFTPKMEAWLQHRLYARLNGHGKCDLPISVMRQTVLAAIRAHLKARSGAISIAMGHAGNSSGSKGSIPRVRRKGLRNPLTWLGADSVKISLEDKALYFPGLTVKSKEVARQRGHTGLRFFPHSKWPEGKVAGTIRMLRKPRGWYAALVFAEAKTKLPKLEAGAVDILGGDLGFKNVLTLSDRTQYSRNKSEDRLWQQLPKASRKESQHPNHQKTRVGKKQKALDRRRKRNGPAAKINQRLRNAREWRNREILRDVQSKTEHLALLEDNLPSLQKMFGRSILRNALGDLVKRSRQEFPKGAAGRTWTVSMIPGAYSTISCPACLALTGPSGFGQLSIRRWTCSACGTTHDRDQAAAEIAKLWCLDPSKVPNTRSSRTRRSSTALVQKSEPGCGKHPLELAKTNTEGDKSHSKK